MVYVNSQTCLVLYVFGFATFGKTSRKKKVSHFCFVEDWVEEWCHGNTKRGSAPAGVQHDASSADSPEYQMLQYPAGLELPDRDNKLVVQTRKPVRTSIPAQQSLYEPVGKSMFNARHGQQQQQPQQQQQQQTQTQRQNLPHPQQQPLLPSSSPNRVRTSSPSRPLSNIFQNPHQSRKSVPEPYHVFQFPDTSRPKSLDPAVRATRIENKDIKILKDSPTDRKRRHVNRKPSKRTEADFQSTGSRPILEFKRADDDEVNMADNERVEPDVPRETKQTRNFETANTSGVNSCSDDSDEEQHADVPLIQRVTEIQTTVPIDVCEVTTNLPPWLPPRPPQPDTTAELLTDPVTNEESQKPTTLDGDRIPDRPISRAPSLRSSRGSKERLNFVPVPQQDSTSSPPPLLPMTASSHGRRPLKKIRHSHPPVELFPPMSSSAHSSSPVTVTSAAQNTSSAAGAKRPRKAGIIIRASELSTGHFFDST